MNSFKNIFLFSLIIGLSPLLLNQANAQLFEDEGFDDDMVCIQKTQAAVDKDGTCEVFSTSCEVPTDWKAIPSCDLVSKAEKRASLRDRLIQRALLRSEASEEENTEESENDETTKRIGSGSLTRTYERTRRLPTSQSTTTANKTFISKGINATKASSTSDTEEETTTDSVYPDYYTTNRSSYRKRSDIDRSGELNTLTNWDDQTEDHITKKSYGRNPYRLGYQYAEDQKEARDALESEVDLEERKYSRTRRYRGERKLGTLEGDAQYLKELTEQEQEVKDKLIEEENSEQSAQK